MHGALTGLLAVLADAAQLLPRHAAQGTASAACGLAADALGWAVGAAKLDEGALSVF